MILKEPRLKSNNGKTIKYYIDSRGCWVVFSHKTNPKGYARCTRGNKTVLIHRYVYALRRGEIPSGLSVLHSCDTPLCINPKHLWLGTLEDNNNDRVAKGRTKSKLKVWDVMEIRHLYDLGHRQKDIAKLYNTTQTNISMIITRNTWSHI